MFSPDSVDGQLVIVGALDQSPIIQSLAPQRVQGLGDLKGKWEQFQLQVVDQPFTNIDQALIITGSDKRGAIYGMYELSRKIGVSPWYCWADVPVRQTDAKINT